MKTLLILLIMLCPLLSSATNRMDEISIAIHTNIISSPQYSRFMVFLGQQSPTNQLSDFYHGIKTTGWIMGGEWFPLYDPQGKTWMCQNFWRWELETPKTQYQTDTNGVVTNTIHYGLPVNAARIATMKGAAAPGVIKMSDGEMTGTAQFIDWGLSVTNKP